MKKSINQEIPKQKLEMDFRIDKVVWSLATMDSETRITYFKKN